MKRVPDMISTKDLSYIEDMINWNVTAAKTAYHFSNKVENEDLSELFNNVSAMHAEHVHTLLEILKDGELNEQQ